MTNDESPPDPRPTVRQRPDGAYEVGGARCADCGSPTVSRVRRCPLCGGPVAPAYFGPLGTVWSDTTVHVPVPGRVPPYRLAYVDLDDGPRIVADLATGAVLSTTGRVRLTGATKGGDLTVAVEGGS